MVWLKRFKKYVVMYVIFSCTSATTVFMQMQLPENLGQRTPVVEGIKANIEAAITLTELQEILSKIKDDLDERIDFLDASDSPEIIKILINRRQVLMEYITKLHGLDEEAINMYLNRMKKKKSNKLLWGLAITGALMATAALVAATYDVDNGTVLNRPSLEQFKANLKRASDRIKLLWVGVPKESSEKETLPPEEETLPAEGGSELLVPPPKFTPPPSAPTPPPSAPSATAAAASVPTPPPSASPASLPSTMTVPPSQSWIDFGNGVVAWGKSFIWTPESISTDPLKPVDTTSMVK